MIELHRAAKIIGGQRYDIPIEIINPQQQLLVDSSEHFSLYFTDYLGYSLIVTGRDDCFEVNTIGSSTRNGLSYYGIPGQKNEVQVGPYEQASLKYSGSAGARTLFDYFDGHPFVLSNAQQSQELTQRLGIMNRPSTYIGATAPYLVSLQNFYPNTLSQQPGYMAEARIVYFMHRAKSQRIKIASYVYTRTQHDQIPRIHDFQEHWTQKETEEITSFLAANIALWEDWLRNPHTAIENSIHNPHLSDMERTIPIRQAHILSEGFNLSATLESSRSKVLELLISNALRKEPANE